MNITKLDLKETDELALRKTLFDAARRGDSHATSELERLYDAKVYDGLAVLRYAGRVWNTETEKWEAA